MSFIKEYCQNIGITINERKTQIVKISRGITFLKRRFFFSKGKLIEKLDYRSVVRMRRKLKKLKSGIENKKFNIKYVDNLYKSWIGGIKRYKTYKIQRSMKNLFLQLFGEVKIPKKKINLDKEFSEAEELIKEYKSCFES